MASAMNDVLGQMETISHSMADSRTLADEFCQRLGGSADSAATVGQLAASIGTGVFAMQEAMRLVSLAQKARRDVTLILHGHEIDNGSLSDMEKQALAMASERHWVKGSEDREALIEIYDELFANIEQQLRS